MSISRPEVYVSTPSRGVRGTISLPGDKSISHRALMLGSIARGLTTVRGFLRGEDNLATVNAFRLMGVEIQDDGQALRIAGRGLRGLSEPSDIVDCGNSGTAMRLLTGLLAGQQFFSVLTGDRYLRNRPMKRVVEPLALMGAAISGRDGGNRAPLALSGRPLRAISYRSPIASAQVKSALLLAGMYADGETDVTEPHRSRDHSERMLRYFGADIETFGTRVRVRGGQELEGREVEVPGDISSAAFFIVAALVIPHSELLLRGIGVNPTRTGILDILATMGANVELLNTREISGETVADILVKSSQLKGIEIAGDLVPRAIDEFPIISIAAALAEGTTVIHDAQELRVKETDRIAAMAENLRRVGVHVEEVADGMTIVGTDSIRGNTVDSFGDHRIAMAMLVAGLAADGSMQVTDTRCIATSFPTFFSLLEKVAYQ